MVPQPSGQPGRAPAAALLYVVPGQPDRKVWWRNLRQPTQVCLRLQGRDREGTAAASSDPEAVAAGLRRRCWDLLCQ